MKSRRFLSGIRCNASILFENHHVKTILLPLIVPLLLTVTAQVGADSYAVALRPGTLGISIEGIRSLSTTLDARVGVSYFSFTYNGGSEKDDYFFDSDCRLSAASALVDWYPRSSPFHISGGVFFNFNDIRALLTPSRSHEVNGRVYTPEMLGNLSAKVGFNTVTPYFGVGVAFIHPGTGLGYMFDIGALYQGPPRVDLSASGLLEPSVEQEPVIEDNIKWFSFYPVVSFGLLYVF